MRERDTPSNRDPDVETQIMLAETPFGDGPHQRERERATAWLVEHADRAYPTLLARLEEGHAGEAIIAILPRFGRVESVAPLERLVREHGPSAWAAGQALALHPQPVAGDALRRALASPEPEAAVIAADALGTRNDPRDCAPLLSAVGAADAHVRYHAVQAAGKLGCLGREALESLARSDEDADVRTLATTLLAPRP